MDFVKHPTLKGSSFWKLSEDQWKFRDKPIELTVALPLKNMKKILRLCLESLKRQVNIDFNWELIVWDDDNVSYDMIKEYLGKLPGCVLVLYRNINPKTDYRKNNGNPGKFLLIDKWIGMANVASKSSKVYVLTAGDDYCSPNRLHIHFEHFKKSKCMLSMQIKSIFVNMNKIKGGNNGLGDGDIDKRLLIYDGLMIDPGMTSNHPFMAYRTRCVRKVIPVNQFSRIDNYLFRTIVGKNRTNETILEAGTVDKDCWKYGFNTHGYNQISKTRGRFWEKIQPPFRKLNHNVVIKKSRKGKSMVRTVSKSEVMKDKEYLGIEHYIPSDVIDLLRDLCVI